MKILIHSNAPACSTGYGVQCAHLVKRLHEAGHDVAVSATYGQQGSIGSWQIRGLPKTPENRIKVYPQGYDANGSNDVIHNHAAHHFGGDELGGWIITLIDVWVMVNPLLAEFNVAAWVPVDHFPVPSGVAGFFHRSGATPVAMSRYGERLLFDAGLDPVYVPLSVDTAVMRPTPTLEVNGRTVAARELIGVADDAFVVGMVAMNKGWARDRKGFNEALRAFAAFWRRHPEAVLYMHCDRPGGAEGIDLQELAIHAGVPEHALRWCDQYAYRLGVPAEMMAATYTAFDVLLAPSHGEGFCVPLVEAQACGTPVIATDFSAQPELVGAGWIVAGQAEWDPAQHASYVCPFTHEVLNALEQAHRAQTEGAMASLREQAVEFAAGYDADRVFDQYWQPFLASLEPAEAEPVPYDREPMGDVAVIVPAMRAENLARLVDSFEATNDGTATLYVIHDEGFDTDGIASPFVPVEMPGERSTFAEKVNEGFEVADEPWVLLVGDDVEFKPGWIEAARDQSYRYDVIGTNDTSGAPKNPDVAAGRHADHFFVRRSYVDELGASLDGPGVLAPECYRHWFTDKEIVGLAKARGVFTPCHDSIIEHHHPGYDGREDLRQADPVYMAAVDSADDDAKTFRGRLPLIEMQRTTRAKTR